jgi:acyl-coenzyme A thioesterase PaaI-like protein
MIKPSSSSPNKLLSIVNRIHRAGLPDRFTQIALTLAFNSQIKYAGTTGIRIRQWQGGGGGSDDNDNDNDNTAIVTLQNRRHIQNHLGGIHATAMATLAESTTGMLFGLYVPDTHVPLLKGMRIQYVARAVGDLKAVATLTPQQQRMIQTTDKGSLVVPVKVTDDQGKEPIHCEMEWAWTTKRKASPPKSVLPSENKGHDDDVEETPIIQQSKL